MKSMLKKIIVLFIGLHFIQPIQIIASDDPYIYTTRKSMGGWRISANKNHEEMGYARIYVDNNIGELNYLWVKRDLRKKGLGSKLVKMAIRQLSDLNCTEVKVKPYPFEAGLFNVREEEEKLYKFYGRHGFQQKNKSCEFLWLTIPSAQPLLT